MSATHDPVSRRRQRVVIESRDRHVGIRRRQLFLNDAAQPSSAPAIEADRLGMAADLQGKSLARGGGMDRRQAWAM